jgi:hypothetical protein
VNEMPFGGTYKPPRSPGETITVSVDIAGDLDPDDYILSAATTLTPALGGSDGNAAALLIGVPAVLATVNNQARITAGASNPNLLNTVVAQQVGANPANPGGFLPGLTYAWRVTAFLASGNAPTWTEYIPVGKI